MGFEQQIIAQELLSKKLCSLRSQCRIHVAYTGKLFPFIVKDKIDGLNRFWTNISLFLILYLIFYVSYFHKKYEA